MKKMKIANILKKQRLDKYPKNYQMVVRSPKKEGEPKNEDPTKEEEPKNALMNPYKNHSRI